jgi:hypothetical protein
MAQTSINPLARWVTIGVDTRIGGHELLWTYLCRSIGGGND